MFVIAVTYTCIGIMMFLFLVPDPREIGIIMPEENPQEDQLEESQPSEIEMQSMGTASQVPLPIEQHVFGNLSLNL